MKYYENQPNVTEKRLENYNKRKVQFFFYNKKKIIFFIDLINENANARKIPLRRQENC